jgi:hypothetical protein
MSIKGRWPSISLSMENNVLVDTVQVVKEVPQSVESMWPDDESVFHVMEPAEGLMGNLIKRDLFEILQEEVGNYWS